MKIFGLDIPVQYKEPHELGFTSEGNPVMGSYSTTRGTIMVDNQLTNDLKYETLLHEVIEVINNSLELDMEHNVISSISTGIYQVLKDNGGDLKKWK